MKLSKITLPFSIPSEISSVDISPPEKLILPLANPWGVMKCKCKEGDEVKMGQLLAESDAPWKPFLHAPISGRVEAIKVWPLPDGKQEPAVVIRNNGGKHEELGTEIREESSPVRIADSIAKNSISEVDPYPWPLPIRLASPDVARKLWGISEAPFDNPIEVLIINGLDRQPGDFLRSWFIGNLAELIAAGARLVKKIANPDHIVLAIPRKKPLPAILERTLDELNVEIRRCPTKYPIALEPILIQFITGREVPQPSGDAREIGVAVVDVISLAKIAQSSATAHPILETTIQLSVPSRGVHQVVRAPIGTPLEKVVGLLKVGTEDISKVVVGGLCLGYAQYDYQVPITQEVESIFIQTGSEISHYSNRSCINCGYCVRVCPMNLLPNELSKYCEYQRFVEAKASYLLHCIECGLCSYVCPAKRPLLQLLRLGKRELEEIEMRNKS